MEFREEYLDRFHKLFDEIKHKIRNTPGCESLELHEDAKLSTVRYTYSIWRSEEDLNNYRHSEMFGEVWPRTKEGFAAKPQAYSLSLLDKVE